MASGSTRLQAHDGLDSDSDRAEGRNAGEVSGDDVKKMKDLASVSAGISEAAPGEYLAVDGGELGVQQLLARADTAESSFEHGGAVKDIDDAIEYRSQVLSLTPDGHARKPTQLRALGFASLRRFMLTGKLADVDNSINCLRQAALLPPDVNEDKVTGLKHLGVAYQSRFERLGELADVKNAIEYQTLALSLVPGGHADKPKLLNNLGMSYESRFGCLGVLADLDKAIECETHAVLLTPDGDAYMPSRLSNLGISCWARFGRLGELEDVDKAIEYQTQAVLLAPDGHTDKPSLLNSLGASHWSRFGRLDEIEDLDKAIQYQTQAVLLTHDGRGNKPKLLSNLAISCQSRFNRLGELADLDQAIEYQTRAVLLTPDRHADKPSLLGNLGLSYASRFSRLGELEDLDRAIDYQTEAVRLTPDEQAYKPKFLNNLGSSYQSRFGRLGESGDLDRAIEYQIKALRLTPDGHSDRPNRLNNLGNSYQSRFECLHELGDMDKAIEYATEAVLLTPDRHSTLPNRLNNLGKSYQYRFKYLGKPEDLDKAIEYQTQAVLLTPDGHADRPRWLDCLGDSYKSRFNHSGEFSDLESALASFQTSAQLVVTSPRVQSGCARKWANCLSLFGRSPQSAYERCMELIPRLIWLGTTINQRYILLNGISDLATEAAAWAISVQEYDLALEWLEEGRSIVWNQILQLRSPFDNLAAVEPVLAQQLKDAATQLERAGSRQAAPASSANISLDLVKEAQHHHNLATQWEQLLGKVRRISGFHNFMHPRKANELTPAAGDSTVVAINVHETRCDALIIQPNINGITHVPLGSLSIELALSTREKLASLVGYRGIRSRGLILRPADHPVNFSKILATLWSEITKPILDHLGYVQKLPVDELPRITWCTTGAISFLPLHAAGCYNGTQPNVPDLVVSSYTPTLSALLSPESQPSGPHMHAGILAVGQAKYSNGLNDLPGTIDELTAVKKYTNNTRYVQLDGSGATVDAVLNAMDEHSWVHLACHAIQNRDNTAHSAFHLHDGSLTLETITKRSFKNKGLAFLSACQTATGDDKLPDEALHLAAGMLMAGYPSVIATMWSIWDIDGPEVADNVYAVLLKNGKMNSKEAARALHMAVAGLREKVGQGSFKRWVPFIHFGV